MSVTACLNGAAKNKPHLLHFLLYQASVLSAKAIFSYSSLKLNFLPPVPSSNSTLMFVRFSHGSNPRNLRATKPPPSRPPLCFQNIIPYWFHLLAAIAAIYIYTWQPAAVPSSATDLCRFRAIPPHTVWHQLYVFSFSFSFSLRELPRLQVKALTTSRQSHHTYTVWPSDWKDVILHSKQSNKTDCVNFY